MRIVLIHGSGGTPRTWSEVIPLLERRGHSWSAIQNGLSSLGEDVRDTVAHIDGLGTDVILVGHSYGGAVITEAGNHHSVKALIYVAAFMPDAGESVNGIVERYAPAEASRYMRRTDDGGWFTHRSPEYWEEIAPDVPEGLREALSSELGLSQNAIFTESVTSPAWARKPAWSIIATADKTLSTEIQFDMSRRAGARTIEVETSHFLPHVAPELVVDVIERVIGEVQHADQHAG